MSAAESAPDEVSQTAVLGKNADAFNALIAPDQSRAIISLGFASYCACLERKFSSCAIA